MTEKRFKVEYGGVETGLLASGLVILNCVTIDKHGHKNSPDKWIGIPMKQALDLAWKILSYEGAHEKYLEKQKESEDGS